MATIRITRYEIVNGDVNDEHTIWTDKEAEADTLAMLATGSDADVLDFLADKVVRSGVRIDHDACDRVGQLGLVNPDGSPAGAIYWESDEDANERRADARAARAVSRQEDGHPE